MSSPLEQPYWEQAFADSRHGHYYKYRIVTKAEPDGRPQSFRFRIVQPDFVVIHFPVALSDNIVAHYGYHVLTEWQRMPRFLSKSERSRGFVFF